jgi:hypothetical protein
VIRPNGTVAREHEKNFSNAADPTIRKNKKATRAFDSARSGFCDIVLMLPHPGGTS